MSLNSLSVCIYKGTVAMSYLRTGRYSSGKTFLCQVLVVCSNNQIKVIAWGINDSVHWDLFCFLYAIQVILVFIDYVNVFTFHVQCDSLKMFMTLTTRKDAVDSVTNA